MPAKMYKRTSARSYRRRYYKKLASARFQSMNKVNGL